MCRHGDLITEKILISWKKCRGGLRKWVEGLEGYSYSDRLRILGLTTLGTRFLDLIEVFKILRGFKKVDPERFFEVVRDSRRQLIT